MPQQQRRPLVDIVIPVHSLTRPLARAVDSAVAAALPLGRERFVITVVAHHLSPEQVGGMLSEAQREQVEIIGCPDEGITAGVPRTTALERTTATYISFMDSDDTLDPGAVSRWVGVAERHGSDLVIPGLFHTNGMTDITPLTRPGRGRNLDAVADRLVYRGSVFGLARVATVRRLGARFDRTTPTAEDLAYSMKLYVLANRIDYAAGFPTYVMRDDANDRVSRKALAVKSQMAAAVALSRQEWFAATDPALRAAYALKFIRINLFEAVEAHLRRGSWDRGEATAAAESLAVLVDHVPGAREQFSRADAEVVELLETMTTDLERLRRALAARRRYATPAALLTPHPEWMLARNAPLRIYTAAVIQVLRYRWHARRRPGPHRYRETAALSAPVQYTGDHAHTRRQVAP